MRKKIEGPVNFWDRSLKNKIAAAAFKKNWGGGGSLFFYIYTSGHVGLLTCKYPHSFYSVTFPCVDTANLYV